MAALDEQEAETRDRRPAPELSAAEVVGYLRDLPRLWDDAPGSRRGLAEGLFERVEVLGLRRMHLEPTPAAVAAGLVEAFSSASAGYGRGERICAATSDAAQIVRFVHDDGPTRQTSFPRSEERTA